MKPTRQEFLRVALECMGTPYRWAGKDPKLGLDCSGLVTHSLWAAGGPDWRQTHNTDKLWNELQSTVSPRAGDLAFYGGKRLHDVEHVMIWLAEGVTFGACSGDSTCVTIELAKQMDARVKVKPKYLYRSDFRAFRSMPLI